MTASLGVIGTNTNPVQVQVCNDNGSGTSPGNTCSVFTGTNPSSGSYVNTTYTGSFTATANQVIWIVLSVPVAGGDTQYAWNTSNSSPGNNNAEYFSGDQGSTWAFAGSGNYALALAGTAVAPPAPIPTLGDWAKIAMALMLVAGGIWMTKRRRSVQDEFGRFAPRKIALPFRSLPRAVARDRPVIGRSRQLGE